MVDRELDTKQMIFSVVPFFHAYGAMMLICYMLNGETIVFLPKFEPVAFLSSIQVYIIYSFKQSRKLSFINATLYCVCYRNTKSTFR